MQIVKYIILLIILILSILVGILMSKRYSSRLEQLVELKNALNMLETKIKFTYDPLNEIFIQISQNTAQNIGQIFCMANGNMKKMRLNEAWKSAITDAELCLKEEDKNILKKLGNMLRKN